jgi:nitrogenase molybdenum-cofactor synthesis protein NifE
MQTFMKSRSCGEGKTPSAPSGSCAFDGAKVILQPITDAAHLVHGPIACEGNSWDYRHAASSGPTLFRTSLTTDLTELDIVMGVGEKRLYASLSRIIKEHAPAAVFVYETCVTALIGDDVSAVCKIASERFGTPCIPVEAAGFLGPRNFGNRLGAQALFDHVIGTHEPEVVTDLDINLLGEFNLAGELWQVKPLFEELGIRVHACLTGDSRYAEVASCHRVRANVVMCSVAMINLAENMQERYGIPFYEGSFYGIENTSNTLRAVAELLVARGADPALLERTRALIEREEARAHARIAPFRARIRGQRALIQTGGYKSWSLIASLEDVGFTVVGTTIRKGTEKDRTRARNRLKPPGCAFEQPQVRMRTRLKELQADILISGGRWQYLAQSVGIPWIDINQRRYSAYAGYAGAVKFAHHLEHAVNNPVWKTVRRAAPWEETELPAPKHQEQRPLGLGARDLSNAARDLNLPTPAE